MKKLNSTRLELRSSFVHNYPYFYQSMTIAAQALANICIIHITIIFPVGQYDRDKSSMIWRLRWKQIISHRNNKIISLFHDDRVARVLWIINYFTSILLRIDQYCLVNK